MWRRGLGELSRGIAQLLFPNSCLLCDAPEHDVPFRHGLCIHCVRALAPEIDRACPRCALTVGPHADLVRGCSACRGESLGFEAAYRLGAYDGKLRDAAIRIKKSSGESLAEMLGRVLHDRHGERLRSERIDLVVPVPLHWQRKLTRGYNQAAALARELSGGLGTTFAAHVLRRVRHTPQQIQPSASARQENVRGAFRTARRASLAGRTVLLVDDVMTTGSTLGEAARTLRAAGAERVLVAILARRE